MSKPAELKVKAAPGRTIYRSGPDGRPVRRFDADGRDASVISSEEWELVPNTRFYRKRIQAGDLIEFAEPVAAVEPLEESTTAAVDAVEEE